MVLAEWWEAILAGERAAIVQRAVPGLKHQQPVSGQAFQISFLASEMRCHVIWNSDVEIESGVDCDAKNEI